MLVLSKEEYGRCKCGCELVLYLRRGRLGAILEEWGVARRTVQWCWGLGDDLVSYIAIYKKDGLAQIVHMAILRGTAHSGAEAALTCNWCM